MSKVQLIGCPNEMRLAARKICENAKSIGFVPTLGCLHQGHLSLVEQARRDNDVVIVSIFVNKRQFGPSEDFDSYPRNIKRDRELCERADVDFIFAPPLDAVYPSNFQTVVDGGELTKLYFGKSRPNFFGGVLTVVNILLQLIRPNRAYFGEKDFQQLFLINQMKKDFWHDTEIVAMPIVRESDGLAMSSRNTYLDKDTRHLALGLFETILNTQELIRAGETNIDTLLVSAREKLGSVPLMTLDYVEIIDDGTLLPTSILSNTSRILLAANLGHRPVRLIDNARLIRQHSG